MILYRSKSRTELARWIAVLALLLGTSTWSVNSSASPVVAPDTATTPEDTEVEVAVLDNDFDDDCFFSACPLFRIANLTSAANGTVDIVRGPGPDRVRYVPDSNFSGTDTFTYTAFGFRNEESAPATVTITVTPVNDPPDSVDDSATTAHDTAVTIAVLANDTDIEGNALSITALTQPRNGTAVIAGTSVTYTPNPGFSGTDQFTYRAQDSSVSLSPATVRVVVTPNQLPSSVIAGGNRTIPDSDRSPGEVVLLDGSGSSDPDGTIVSYQWFNGQTVIGSGVTLSVRLPDGDNRIRLVVTDDDNGTGSSTVTLSITAPPPNELPTAVIAGGNRTIPDSDRNPGEVVLLDGSGSRDLDGTIVTYQWFNGQTVIGSGVTLNVRLPDGDNPIRLVVTDDDNGTGSSTVTLSIAAPPPRTTLESLPDLTPNERSVAKALDDLCLRLTEQAQVTQEQADLAARCDAIVLDNDTARQTRAVSELGAQDLNVLRTQTLLISREQTVGVLDRLMALQSGARGLGAVPQFSLTIDGKAVPPEMLASASQLFLGPADEAGEENWQPSGSESGAGWGFWMRGTLGSSEMKASASDPGFDADQWGVTSGLDYRPALEQTVLGVAIGLGQSDATFNPTDEGGVDTQAWSVTLYAGVYPADSFFYADGFMSYCQLNSDTERLIQYEDVGGTVDRTAQGSTDSSTMSVGLGAGHDVLLGNVTVSPNVRFTYIDAVVDGFTESGASGLDLVYAEQSFESATASVGLRITATLDFGWMVLLPHFRGDALWELSNDSGAFGVRFANDPFVGTTNPTPAITVSAEEPDESYLLLAAGLAAEFRHGISGYVQYERLEGLEFLEADSLAFGLRIQYGFR